MHEKHTLTSHKHQICTVNHVTEHAKRRHYTKTFNKQVEHILQPVNMKH